MVIVRNTQESKPVWLYTNKLMGVTMPLIIDQENAINNQSFTTPATFMVKAEVLPTIKNTAKFKAKAHRILVYDVCEWNFGEKKYNI